MNTVIGILKFLFLKEYLVYLWPAVSQIKLTKSV